MKLGWNKHLAAALIGVAGMCGLLAPAQAVIVTTSYDPLFGAGPLSGYGWKATVNYEIPAACFSTPFLGSIKVGIGGTVINCGFAALSQPFTVLTAEVGIYAAADSNFLLDVLTFDENTLPLSAICVDQGSLDCVYSVMASFDPFALVPRWSNTLVGGAAFNGDINFRMGLLGDAVLEYQDCPAGTTDCAAAWTRAPAPTSTESFINTDPDWRDNTKLRLGAQSVPEPGALALVLLALGAGVVTTRRR